ncbi:hypothetical protein J437_LFUL015018 [Ladona fulva]|uniref:DDE Tnp4 domain-containing protein n=1 Tax=Ladona fulva TaxID=123851 RepID=A0A8K0KH92_LADFU|nr:hypothetical protein J437_LFUL015018 [Ladona fulva]
MGLEFSETREEWLRHAEAFNVPWNFPYCLGALDGKNIAIQATTKWGSGLILPMGEVITLTTKGLIELPYLMSQMLTTGLLTLMLDATEGCQMNCSLYDSLENDSASFPDHEPLPGRNMPVPYFFVADDAFAMRSYILKPNPFCDQTPPNQIFN